jgi:hypothetical protein
MTPMASGISYRQKDRLVFSDSFLKSLITPRIPIYRVIGVLKKIWALFTGELILVFLTFQ